MNLIYQKSLSRILLISFFLQSCGIEVPISGHQPEGVGPDGVQQLETTYGGSAVTPLSTEKLQGQLQPSLVGPHDESAQALPETAKRYVGPMTLQEEIAADKQERKGLQTYAQAEADELAALLNQRSTPEEQANEATYTQRSRALFHDISGRFKAFLARIFHESEQKLGPTPCQYTVMGLGSMALQQMMPYSDLAFAILMEESSDQEAASAYFKQLTHLVNFRVSNKTLSERQEEPYTLIKTVSEMLHYLKNEGSQVAHTDKDLPYILENTCHVHGDKQLYEAYETQKMAFLSDPAIYKRRAIKRILEGTVEWDYRHLGTVSSRINGLGNPGQFPLQFGPEDGDTLYTLKQEIHHLSDRLLYGLALYYGIMPGSGWDAVAQLCERSVICIEAVPHLSYALSFAHMLRLRTCLHHGQQQEPVTMLSGLPQEQFQIEISKALCLPQEELEPGSSLFRYYYTVLPLYRKISAFLTQLDIHSAPTSGLSTSTLTLNREVEADFFIDNGFTFYDTSVITRGNIHHRLSQWESAKNCYEKALKIQRILHGNAHPSVAHTLHNLGTTYMALCDYIESRAYYSEALQILKQVYEEAHPGIASALHNLGIAHSALGQYAQGIVYYLRSLQVSKKVHGDVHPAVVNTLNSLGAVWSVLGEYDQSLTHYVESLGISRRVYSDTHPVVASTLNNLGTIQSALRAYVSSRAYYVESLNMSKQLYGDQHLTIASILNNLGNTDNALGEHVQSIQYNEAALRIYKQAHGEPHTHATVLTLNSLGTAYQALGEYTQGIQYYKEALAISKEAYEDKYPGVVSTLKGLFLLWEQSGCQDALHTLAGFLKTHMYKLHYTGVLASMASEVLQDDTLADAEAAKTIRLARMCKLLRLVDAAPREILGLQHLMLQLRLVNEWLLLCQGEDEEQQGVAALEEEFHLGERLSTWVKQSSLKYNGRYHHDTALARVPSAALLALLSTCSSVARCYKAELMKETLSMYSSQFESDAPDAHRVVLSALKSSVAIDLFAEEILPLLQLTISSRDCTIRQDTLEIFCVLAKRGISVDYVISSLCEAFQDDDPKVRLDVLASLRSLLENDVLMKSQILPLLEPSSHDSDAKIREMTVEIFCSLVARDAHVQVVLSLLKQPLSNSKLELHHDVLRVLASSIPVPAPEVIHHILNALEDRSYVVRSVALKALPTLVEKGAISEVLPLVQRALKDANIYTVLGVLPTLLELENGVTISEALPLIFNALKDSDSNMRYKAREALPTLLKDAVVSEALSAILSALKDEFRLVRNFAREALTILLENGVELSEALPHILNALQDREGDVRSAVLEELPTLLEKGLAVPEAVPLVLDLLQDSDHDVRRVAGRTLPILLEKGLVVPEPLLLVLDLLKNSDSNVRRVALRILETLLGKGLAVSEVLPLTQNALKDGEGTVRIAALKVLRALVEKGLAVSEALPLILHAFEDREDDTRIAALRALPTLLERGLALSEVLPRVQNALTDRDRSIRGAALEVLAILPEGGLAISEALPLVQKALEDSNRDVRRTALKSLKTLLEKSLAVSAALPLTQNALDDEDDYVRIAALKVLKALLERGLAASEVLPLAQNALKASNHIARSIALQVLPNLLEKTGAVSEILPLMLNALKDTSDHVRNTAHEALLTLPGKIGDMSEVLPLMLSALQDDNCFVRKVAREVLPILLETSAAVSEVLEVLPLMLNVLKDDDVHVRNIASEALQNISTETLIERYWAVKDPSIPTLLMPRLCELALAVEHTEDPDQHQLILYTTTGQSIKWIRSRQEVQEFVELVVH